MKNLATSDAVAKLEFQAKNNIPPAAVARSRVRAAQTRKNDSAAATEGASWSAHSVLSNRTASSMATASIRASHATAYCKYGVNRVVNPFMKYRFAWRKIGI